MVTLFQINMKSYINEVTMHLIRKFTHFLLQWQYEGKILPPQSLVHLTSSRAAVPTQPFSGSDAASTLSLVV
jgi:hypothetical protein